MIRLLALQARRDRVLLPIWILGIFALVVLGSTAIAAEFGSSESDRRGILTVALATPSLLALRGIPHGTSLGSLLMFQQFAYLAVLVGLMNTFFATRHGRGDEESGRRELVGAAPVSRLAPLAATLVLGVAANLAIGIVATAGFALSGMPASGSLVAGVAFTVTGLVFLGVGLLAGQLSPTSRGANGIGAIAVIGAYLLRAAGDALGTPDLRTLTVDAAWPSWLSPIGWGEQTFAFTEDRIEPLVPGLVLAGVLVGATLLVHARRDLGQSLLPERLGRARARATLASAFGLVWRLQWPSLVAWSVSGAILGALIASLATSAAGTSLDNAQVLAVLESLGRTDASDLAGLFTAAIMVFVGVLAAAAGVQSILRLRAEESSGRAELLLSTPVGRVRWLVAGVAAGVLSVAVVLGATGATAALAFAVAGDPANASRAAGQAWVQAPAALVFVAAAAALVALLPRLSIAASWGVFVAGAVVGLLGDLLDLPQTVRDASPLSHVPLVPVDDWGPSVLLGAVAVALVAVSAIGVRRRSLTG